MKKVEGCLLCERVEKIKKGEYPYLIQELDECYWLLGEHQYFEGYTILVTKDHHKEMTDLNPEKVHLVFSDLMRAHKVIENLYQPLKMNLCSLGNVVPHIHWHLFPRYKSDPQHLDPVWLRMNEFDQAKIDANEAQIIIKKIQKSMLG